MKYVCPKCRRPLILNDRVFRCENNHCFDMAKSGYVNLLLNNTNAGDNKEMVAGRIAFLEKGYYSFLRDKINEIIGNVDTLVDLACGEGYYTRELKAVERYGFDLSKPAITYASKHDKDTHYAIASIFALPLEDDCADVVTTIFAPVAKDEIKRILKTGGRFILVSPGPDHLFELKKAVYDTPYQNAVEPTDTGLAPLETYTIKEKHIVPNADLYELFRMTPYCYKTSEKDMAKLKNTAELEVTFEFFIQIYRKETV